MVMTNGALARLIFPVRGEKMQQSFLGLPGSSEMSSERQYRQQSPVQPISRLLLGDTAPQIPFFSYLSYWKLSQTKRKSQTLHLSYLPALRSALQNLPGGKDFFVTTQELFKCRAHLFVSVWQVASISAPFSQHSSVLYNRRRQRRRLSLKYIVLRAVPHPPLICKLTPLRS